jgi:hypothetical protein
VALPLTLGQWKIEERVLFDFTYGSIMSYQ